MTPLKTHRYLNSSAIMWSVMEHSNILEVFERLRWEHPQPPLCTYIHFSIFMVCYVVCAASEEIEQPSL